jgi:hypothetical protein
MVGGFSVALTQYGLLIAFGQEWYFSIRSAGEDATIVWGINNRGQIVGQICSTVGDGCKGFLLTPPNVVEDVSASASPDGSRAPVVTVIVDNALETWTLGPGEEILRNGVQAAGGYGSQILWHGGDIYVLGDDYNWWRWTGSTWSFAGANDPASSVDAGRAVRGARAASPAPTARQSFRISAWVSPQSRQFFREIGRPSRLRTCLRRPV